LTKTSDGVLLCSDQAGADEIGAFERLLDDHRFSQRQIVDFARRAAAGIVKYSESIGRKAIGDGVSQEILSIVNDTGSEEEHAQKICALVLMIYSRDEKEGSPSPLRKEVNRRRGRKL
jgi:SOS response regulatory protein OraA/RecX